MSVVTKQVVIRSLEQDLRDKLTASEVDIVLESLAMQLTNYEIERIGSDVAFHEAEEYIDAFLAAKRIEGRSPKTIAHYGYILRKATKEMNTPIKSLTVYHLRQYLTNEKKRGVSDRTLNGVRSIFSSFFNWLNAEGMISCSPCVNLGHIKYTKKVRSPFTSIELESLKEQCLIPRDKAIVHFLLSSGCRISEICALNRNDIDLQNKECVVLGKGNKERIVYLDDVTAMLLTVYLENRKDDFPALFIGKGSSRMTPGGIRKMLSNVAKRAGVENVHPHRFRRTLATNLINRGMSIQEVASILGHENINTTMTYVYVDKINVKNNYRRYT